MVKRLKNWLRAIIAEEVAKVAASLANERKDTIAIFKNIESEVLRSFEQRKAEVDKALEVRIQTTLETEYNAFLARLKDSFHDACKDDPSHWKADGETVAANHALRKAK